MSLLLVGTHHLRSSGAFCRFSLLLLQLLLVNLLHLGQSPWLLQAVLVQQHAPVKHRRIFHSALVQLLLSVPPAAKTNLKQRSSCTLQSKELIAPSLFMQHLRRYTLPSSLQKHHLSCCCCWVSSAAFSNCCCCCCCQEGAVFDRKSCSSFACTWFDVPLQRAAGCCSQSFAAAASHTLSFLPHVSLARAPEDVKASPCSNRIQPQRRSLPTAGYADGRREATTLAASFSRPRRTHTLFAQTRRSCVWSHSSCSSKLRSWSSAAAIRKKDDSVKSSCGHGTRTPSSFLITCATSGVDRCSQNCRPFNTAAAGHRATSSSASSSSSRRTRVVGTRSSHIDSSSTTSSTITDNSRIYCSSSSYGHYVSSKSGSDMFSDSSSVGVNPNRYCSSTENTPTICSSRQKTTSSSTSRTRGLQYTWGRGGQVNNRGCTSILFGKRRSGSDGDISTATGRVTACLPGGTFMVELLPTAAPASQFVEDVTEHKPADALAEEFQALHAGAEEQQATALAAYGSSPAGAEATRGTRAAAAAKKQKAAVVVPLALVGKQMLCTLGGKLRVNRIRVQLYDSVDVEYSLLDHTRGRIVYRRRGDSPDCAAGANAPSQGKRKKKANRKH